MNLILTVIDGDNKMKFIVTLRQVLIGDVNDGDQN